MSGKMCSFCCSTFKFVGEEYWVWGNQLCLTYHCTCPREGEVGCIWDTYPMPLRSGGGGQRFMHWIVLCLSEYSGLHACVGVTSQHTLGACDWSLSLRNCPVFHSAGAVNPMGKLNNCRQLLSESDQPNAPFDTMSTGQSSLCLYHLPASSA